ncbi:DASS family sodium-coupled anion symporter [bacterium]|nr:DASS family sodium-coupled anion symporter [bacterium]
MKNPTANVWEPEATKGTKVPFLRRFHFALFALFVAIGAAIAFGPRPEGLSVEAQRTIGIFVMCTLLWVTGLIPLQITSVLAIILLPILNVMPSADAFALFGNNAVFFILGAFIISAVLVDCGLSTRLTIVALEHSTDSPRRLRTGIFLFAAFASFWMSEHAVAAMMFPIVLGIVRALGLKPNGGKFGKSFFFALAWGCVIGGIATYLGGARNPLAVGILYADTGVRIGFLQWMVASFPLVILVLVIAHLFLTFAFPQDEPVDIEAARLTLREQHGDLGRPSRKEFGVALVTVATIVGWITLHHSFGLAIVALLAVAALFIFRLAEWPKVEDNVNWGIILMYGGAIALGSALNSSGAAKWVVDRTFGQAPFSDTTLLIVLGMMSLALTEFISNAAVVSVMMPVAIGIARARGIPFEVMAFAIALPSGLSYVLPMGTPATAIAYGSGYLSMKDFLRAGVFMMICSLIAFSLVAKFYWPLIGYG